VSKFELPETHRNTMTSEWESSSGGTEEHFDGCVIPFDNVRRRCGRNVRKKFHWTTAYKPG